jgi:aminoglycoside phosphotransferase (APT) family kinase protein
MDIARRLAPWVTEMVPGARNVRIDGLDRVEMGHSAETLLLTLSWEDGAGDHCEDVALRIRPPAPGLLEPYDLQRQVDVLRALESTPVRAPRAYWLEPSGHVLGREFYVMERLPGSVYERGVPDELVSDPNRIRRMCESMVEQLAAIHTVDIGATHLEGIGDGRRYLDREIDHWTSEIQRVQRGPLPALERLAEAVREQQPPQSPSVTLVHGDAKPGNFAFEGSEVSAVFDWEMASIGDPLVDIGGTGGDSDEQPAMVPRPGRFQDGSHHPRRGPSLRQRRLRRPAVWTDDGCHPSAHAAGVARARNRRGTRARTGAPAPRARTRGRNGAESVSDSGALVH